MTIDNTPDPTLDDTDLDDVQAPSAVLPDFAGLGVQPQIVEALHKVGITHPFPIQAMTLPVALTGNDIIGQAKTGTGKTLGFGIPALQRVIGPGEPGFEDLLAPGKPQALVVVPTRELAVQVAGDIDTAAKLRSARVLTVYGGRAYEPQVEALRKGIEIVVGTPGRLLDLAQQGHLNLGHARIVVLDEADEMLDLGFLPDVERILALTPDGRQMMLFSATMPGAVVALARRYMTQPTHIRAADPDDTGATVKAVKQFAYRAHALDKIEMLSRILQSRGRGLTMIFARTKRTVAKVADDLAERGFASAAIHGDLGQGAREQALRAFRNGKVDVLVATDVAARGIDVDDVTHVINYQCPEDEKTYLHRIGRTARAGNTGTAVTFVDWDEIHRWGMISLALDLGMPEAVETYSSSVHLFGDLDIPTGTRGTLPRASRTRAGLDAEQVEDLGETGRGPKGRRPERGGRDSGGRDSGGRDSGGRDSGGRDSGRGGRDSGGRDSGGRDSGHGDRDRGHSRPVEPAAEHAVEHAVEHAAGAVAVADDEPTRTRRNRPRRRTRGGRPIDDAVAEHGSTGPDRAGAADQATATDGEPVLDLVGVQESGADTAGVPSQSGPAEERPARRRRRGGRGRGRSGATSDESQDASEQPVASQA